MDAVTLQLAKKYTAETAEQFGALKGANCQAGTATDIMDGTAKVGKRMPFLWVNDEEQTQTSNMDIMYADIAAMVLASLTTAESQEV